MAHTKQTPRNPVTERPLTTMGVDVQERRAPTKLATKKIHNWRKTTLQAYLTQNPQTKNNNRWY